MKDRTKNNIWTWAQAIKCATLDDRTERYMYSSEQMDHVYQDDVQKDINRLVDTGLCYARF